MERLISFILPAYNVEAYIEECLKSLICQGIDRDKMEIIIIDDGSTDATLQKAKDFRDEHKDYNIILAHQDNSGVSAARNHGLVLAKGKYVWFVDPDDFILPQGLKALEPYLEAEENNIFYLTDIITVGEDATCEGISQNISVGTEKRSFSQSGPWTKIVNRDFLMEQKLFFCERLAYGEDFLWNHMLWQNRKKFSHEYYVKGCLYFYRMRENSAYRKAKADRGKDKKHYENLLMLVEEYEKLYQKPEYHNRELDLTLRQAKQAAVFALVYFERAFFKAELKRLKEKGIYPYRFVWKNLLPSVSVKHTLIDWMMFFLPIGWYAGLLNGMMGRNEKNAS